MFPLSAPQLFNVHGLAAAAAEPHAKMGAHIRVSHDPKLGLPVAPMVVYKAEPPSRESLTFRDNVIFVDKNNNRIVPPFQVSPDFPVTAKIGLQPGEVCIWAELMGRSNATFIGSDLSVGRIGRSRDSVPNRGALAIDGRLRERLSNVLDDGVLRGIERRALTYPLVVEAKVNSPIEPASIGTRSSHPWIFSAPGIVECEITGSGRVEGFRWIALHDEQPLKWNAVSILNLPVASGRRYLSVENPAEEAQRRVRIQTPKRMPLQETQNIPDPSVAPSYNETQEQRRVASLVPTLSEDLTLLTRDVTPPLEQSVDDIVFDEQGREIGVSSLLRLHRVNQAQLDPGTASYLGYKMLDTGASSERDKIVFYRVMSFFRDTTPPIEREGASRRFEQLLFKSQLARLHAEHREISRAELIKTLLREFSRIEGAVLDQDGFETLLEANDYVQLGSVAAVDWSAPLDAVPPVNMKRATHKSWLPITPPQAQREVVVDIEGAKVAALLAAAKTTPSSGSSASSVAVLNHKNKEGWHLPLMLSLNAANSTGEVVARSGSGFISDRTAAASHVRYHLSQQDRFGRFSKWASIMAPAGPRPMPPRPHLQAMYTPPSISDAETTGGRVFIKVPVPDVEGLAPGSYLLKELVLTIEDLSSAAEPEVLVLAEATKVAVPENSQEFFLNVSHVGPILEKTEVRKLRLIARWQDTGNQLSAESEPVTLTLTDPRPPEQLTVPDRLQYSARPDITGLAWVEHRWRASPNQKKFAVYYSDENRLQAWLNSNTAYREVRMALESAPDAAARATVFRNNRSVFPDHLFERLTGVDVEFASGELGFRHPISGSLRLLSFYLVAAEAEQGARPELSNLEFMIFGVPNSDPPQRPALTVVPVAPQADEQDFVVEVTISLLAGATVGDTWRLRRSSFETGNIAKMPVVTQGPMGQLQPGSGTQEGVFRDDGPVEIAAHARLHPWRRYTWVAEVRGAPESGSIATGKPVLGRWSRASDPVSVVMVPHDAPESIDATYIEVDGSQDGTRWSNLMLRFAYRDDLRENPLGTFTLRVSRRLAEGFADEVIHTLPVANYRVEPQDTDPAGYSVFRVPCFTAENRGETVDSGVVYSLELVDPMGRISTATSVVLP